MSSNQLQIHAKNPLVCSALASVLLLFSSATTADSDQPVYSGSDLKGVAQKQTPYVTMNISFEITGLEQAAEEAAEALKLIGDSLHDLADKPELTPEQNERIQRTLSRVGELGQSLTLTVKQLPGTVENSIAPLVTAGNELSDQIRQTVIITSVVFILIILAALAAMYYFVLAPATRSISETTGLLNDLANTLKSTAKIVDKSSKQNLLILEEMRKIQEQ